MRTSQVDLHTLRVAIRLYDGARDAEARRIFMGAVNRLLEAAGVDLLVVDGYLIERGRGILKIVLLGPQPAG